MCNTFVQVPTDESAQENTQSCVKNKARYIILAIVLVGALCIIIPLIITQTTSETDQNDNSTPDKDSQRQDDKGINQCIYNTSTDFLKHLSEDPFGNICDRNSDFVERKCKNTTNTYQCSECSEKEKLPSICFCDKKIHCSNDGTGSRPADDGKHTCSQCMHIFLKTYPFKSRGQCHCRIIPIQKYVECNCYEGYGGFMCSSILQRVCNLEEKDEEERPHCNNTNEDECILKSKQQGKQYVCKSLNESTTKNKSLEQCEHNVII